MYRRIVQKEIRINKVYKRRKKSKTPRHEIRELICGLLYIHRMLPVHLALGL